MNKRNLVVYGLTALPAALVILSGIFKLTANPEIVEGMNRLGVGPYISALGVGEIIFAGLYLIPRTSKIGFLLLICYFSGAMATDLSHNAPINGSLMILVSLYVAGFFRNRSQFLPDQQHA